MLGRQRTAEGFWTFLTVKNMAFCKSGYVKVRQRAYQTHLIDVHVIPVCSKMYVETDAPESEELGTI